MGQKYKPKKPKASRKCNRIRGYIANQNRINKQTLPDDVSQSSPRELQTRPVAPPSSTSQFQTNTASQSNALATNRDETTENSVSPHAFEEAATTYEAAERLGLCIKQLEQQLKSTQEESEEIEVNIYGNRIVNVEHFFRQLQNLNHHDPITGCGIESMTIVGEKKEGLASKFTFWCKRCTKRFVVTNLDFEDKNTVSINHCAVAGSLAIGAGLSQLRELCASMDLPVMSKTLYRNTHDSLSNVRKETAFDVMAQFAKEEYDLAIKHGNKTVDGIPVIEVVVDGCWSKRSYRTNYNALSGCASIVGKRTGKVLYIGIKNKYCTICACSLVPA